MKEQLINFRDSKIIQTSTFAHFYQIVSQFNNSISSQSSNLVNDISLIKTETRIFFSPVIQPIRFGSGYVKGGINAIALG